MRAVARSRPQPIRLRLTSEPSARVGLANGWARLAEGDNSAGLGASRTCSLAVTRSALWYAAKANSDPERATGALPPIGDHLGGLLAHLRLVLRET